MGKPQLEGQIQPAVCLCQQSCVATQLSPFICILSMGAFTLSGRSEVAASETIRPTKPNYFSSYSVTLYRKSWPMLALGYQELAHVSQETCPSVQVRPRASHFTLLSLSLSRRHSDL